MSSPKLLTTVIASTFRLAVLEPGHSTAILMWVDFEEAQRLIRLRQVACIRHNGRIRALRAVDTAVRSQPDKPTPLRRKSVGDSHKNERRDNPPGVWTIDRIRKSSRAVFLAVLTDCSASV